MNTVTTTTWSCSGNFTITNNLFELLKDVKYGSIENAVAQITGWLESETVKGRKFPTTAISYEGARTLSINKPVYQCQCSDDRHEQQESPPEERKIYRDWIT